MIYPKIAEISQFEHHAIIPITCNKEEVFGKNDPRFHKSTLLIGVNGYKNRKGVQISIINGVEVYKNPIIKEILIQIFQVNQR
jgi:hypothetical protein